MHVHIQDLKWKKTKKQTGHALLFSFIFVIESSALKYSGMLDDDASYPGIDVALIAVDSYSCLILALKLYDVVPSEFVTRARLWRFSSYPHRQHCGPPTDTATAPVHSGNFYSLFPPDTARLSCETIPLQQRVQSLLQAFIVHC